MGSFWPQARTLMKNSNVIRTIILLSDLTQPGLEPDVVLDTVKIVGQLK